MGKGTVSHTAYNSSTNALKKAVPESVLKNADAYFKEIYADVDATASGEIDPKIWDVENKQLQPGVLEKLCKHELSWMDIHPKSKQGKIEERKRKSASSARRKSCAPPRKSSGFRSTGSK